MGYAVCHQDATGTLRIDDVESLEAAVAIVERLRNGDGNSDVRVFREVPIEVRTYYKVSIADDEVPSTASVTPEPAPAPDAPVELVTDPAPESVSVVTSAPTASTEPLPGAFPLASSPLPPPPVVEVHDADHDTAGDANRRHSLFSRGG